MHAPLLVALAVAVGAPASKADPKSDSTIVGDWVGQKATAGGKDRPVPAGGITFTFKADGKLTVKEGKRENSDDATYTVDAKKDPAEIDLIPPADKAERGTVRGIYKVDGDTLTLCFSGDQGGNRPTKFESPAKSNVMLMTLKRVKKE